MNAASEAMVVIGVVGGGYAIAILFYSVGYVLRQLGPRKSSRK